MEVVRFYVSIMRSENHLCSSLRNSLAQPRHVFSVAQHLLAHTIMLANCFVIPSRNGGMKQRGGGQQKTSAKPVGFVLLSRIIGAEANRKFGINEDLGRLMLA